MATLTQQEWIAEELRRILADLGHEPPESVTLQKIPFSGMWGWGAPVCFQLASAERKAGRDIRVEQRAQEIAEEVRDRLLESGKYSKVEATRGYINVFFEVSEVARQLLQSVFRDGEGFGRGGSKGERVMVEYSQPNTHKAFHVGHLRNLCLGHSLSRILDFAGFDTLRANYLGDIGLHVIKCLWGYLRFHSGQAPSSEQGRWLGTVYADADRRLSQANTYRDRILSFVTRMTQEGPAGEGVRLALCSRFWERAEHRLNDLAADPCDAKGIEEHRDLTLILGWIFKRCQPEFNEIAHRPVADWVWEVWIQAGGWLRELLSQESAKKPKGQSEGPAPEAESTPLARLVAEYDAIGIHPEEWGYAREIREMVLRWECRDPEIVELWKRTRKWSLDDFQRIYEQLGAEFDIFFYESEVEDEGKEIVREIVERGIATDLRPNGPVLVEIDKRLGGAKTEFRTIVILRSDGTSLYSTKDLALAKKKFEEYRVDRSVYVVDVGQALYFQQIFKVLELWGFEQAFKCFHLAYEIVRLPSGKMSSREGEVVFFDDFFGEALRRARNSVDEKRGAEQFAELPALDSAQRDEVALAVAMGAVKYGMLAVDNNKQILFDFDSALSFEGQTAPYIQYAHARSCRILEKAGVDASGDWETQGLEISAPEVDLLESIAGFGLEVQRAAREYKPLLVAVYLYQLAKAFNDFYRDCPVLRAKGRSRDFRLALVAAARQTLANGLRLLGIPSPRYM